MHEPLALRDLAAIAGRPEERTWEELRPGVEISWLYRTEDDGPAAAFLRYRPGASVPRHRHAGFEHVYVIEGAQSDERGRYRAGDFVVNPPGTSHSVTSPAGCIVLILWARPVEFIDT